MEVIKSVEDFKKFMQENHDLVYANAIDADDITIHDEWMQDSKWDEIYQKEVVKKMTKYNVGEVWWTHFPFDEVDDEKHRPAIIIDDDTIAILAMYVTSQEKSNPFSIEIADWKDAGLSAPSWARIDRIVKISEWRLNSKIGELSQNDLIKILQLVAEINTGKRHEFSLLAVKRADGKLLQMYDEGWKCNLFPYVRTEDNNKVNVDSFASELLGFDATTSYITVANHVKYSVKDEVYKIYKHKLYNLVVNEDYANSTVDEFVIKGKKCRWMSYSEMENDSEIMEKNDEIVAFVKTHIK